MQPPISDASRISALLVRELPEDSPQLLILRGEIEARAVNPILGPGEDSAVKAADFLEAHPAEALRKARRRIMRWSVLAALIACLATAAAMFYEFIPKLAEALPDSAAAWPGTAALRHAAARQLYKEPLADAPPSIFLDDPKLYGEALTTGYTSPWHALAEGYGRQWRSHPDNVVYYARYASAFMMANGSLPEDYDATWRRLDPDNGYWPLLKALLTARNSVYITRATMEAAGKEDAALVNQAAAAPKLESYAGLYRGESLSALRPSNTAVQAQQLDRILDFGSDLPGLWGNLIHFLHYLPDDAGAKPEAQDKISHWFAKEGPHVVFHQRPHAVAPPDPSSAALAGGVLASRCCLGIGVVVFLGLAATMALRTLPRRSDAGRLTACLRQLQQPRDAWKLAATSCGIVLAFSLAAGTCLRMDQRTPAMGSPLPVAPALAAVSSLSVIVWLARRHVSRRCAFLGLGGSRGQSIPTGISLAIALVWFPLMLACDGMHARGGSVSYIGGGGAYFPLRILSAGVCGLILLWLMLSLLLGYASSSANLRHRLLAAHLVPAFLAAAATLALVNLALIPVEASVARRAFDEYVAGK